MIRWYTIEYTDQYRNVEQRTWHKLLDNDGYEVEYLSLESCIITARWDVRHSLQPTNEYEAVIDARVRDVNSGEIVWSSENEGS